MKRSAFSRIGLAALTLWFASMEQADAGPVQCPLNITVKEALALPYPDWQAYDVSASGIYTFYAVMFSEGRPDARVILTPARLNHAKHERIDIYDMTAVATDTLWLTCLYRDTSVTLTRRLEGSFRECRVVYDPKTGFETVQQVDCRK